MPLNKLTFAAIAFLPMPGAAHCELPSRWSGATLVLKMRGRFVEALPEHSGPIRPPRADRRRGLGSRRGSRLIVRPRFPMRPIRAVRDRDGSTLFLEDWENTARSVREIALALPNAAYEQSSIPTQSAHPSQAQGWRPW